MSLILSLLRSSPYFDLPQNLFELLISGAGWLIFLGVIGILLWKWRVYNRPWNQRLWGILFFLILTVPLTSLFIGLRLSAAGALPPQGVPIDPRGPALMLFAALPWMLAGGLLGPLPASALALFSGFFLAYWDTHNPFTPLEFALLAGVFGAAIQQRYRTGTYRLLRHPIVAALLLAIAYPIIFLITTSFLSSGLLANRLDYALTHVQAAGFAVGGELLLAGLFVEVLAAALGSSWGNRKSLLPSPSEKSLQARFVYGVVPLAVVLVIALIAGDWIVAGKTARQLLNERMANAAELASKNVPYFMEAGQNLMLQFADDTRLAKDVQINSVLKTDLQSVPFFNQLYYLDNTGKLLGGYPSSAYESSRAPTDEQVGVQLALTGVQFQIYSIPPEPDGKSAQVSFITPVKDQDGNLTGALVGRTDLNTNPFTRPVLASLDSLSGEDGVGLLLDENGQIVYHQNPALLMTPYTGQTFDKPTFYDAAAPDGTRSLVFYQPAVGRPWAIVLEVPAQRAQQIALNIAIPLLGMIFVLSAVAIIFLRLGLSLITRSLQSLAVEAVRISQGELDHPLPVRGEDEVGQLSRAFEDMRISLKARLDELNQLLLVSQGVASSLEMSQAVMPVLESALGAGANSARVVLSPSVIPELERKSSSTSSFGKGPSTDLYHYLDEQIMALTRQQDRVILTNPSRPRLIRFMPGAVRPEALLALALRHESMYYGALWIAYDKPHQFSDEEVRFLSTLASQAALAAANARLFLNAEIGRQRLAAILASTPDPVLVTDQQDRLLLANPAAWRVLGLGVEWDEGQPIDEVISQTELVELLRSTGDEKNLIGVTLADGRTYSATASSVLAEGQPVGRVCVLRDVTYYKELDSLKSEFVATVSHDLRSPLTLMRGYATMLEMVGELNEQQANYVRKIVSGAESMSRLVNNLLDLGRIEAGIGLQLEMVPIRDVIEKVVGTLQLTANQKHVQLHVNIPDQTIPLLEADQALLQQALQNLVENAVKFTDTGGQVKISVDVRENRMVFDVSDNGIGIAPVDQPRLFEKFYRVSQLGPQQTRGTGLGLAIVKSIVERHGGKVWVKSQLGKGSSFYMAIPLRQPQNTMQAVK